jgi:hypothetical protein
MRRITLSTLAVVIALAAQSAHAQELQLGARGGVNLAASDFESDVFNEDVGTLTAYHFGILLSVDISRFFGMQTEVWYSRKGFAEGKGDVSLKVNYIEMPLLAVIKIPTRFSPHLYVGPVVALESGCKVTTLNEGEIDCEDTDEGPRPKGSDSGILFGGGVTVPFGFGSILLDGFYNLGFTNISETSDTVESVKTRTRYLSVGFIIPFGTPSR